MWSGEARHQITDRPLVGVDQLVRNAEQQWLLLGHRQRNRWSVPTSPQCGVSNRTGFTMPLHSWCLPISPQCGVRKSATWLTTADSLGFTH